MYICKKVGISRKTFYYHWKNYQKFGWSGLCEKSRAPHKVHKKSEEVIDRVVSIRKERGWGPDKIEQYLKSEGVAIGHTTIRKILIGAGLNAFLDKPRKTWGKKRFQRTASNQMWQTDWKLTRDDEWMITYLDDYSRFIPGSQIFHNATTKNALEVLKGALDLYGPPEQILTDQGCQFYTWEDGKTKFTKYLEKQGIQHIVASKRRPTTTGKVERFNGSYEREAWRYPSHHDYIKHWNYERPHQGIGYLIPANLYFKQL
ncbi:MAG: DDE-type integrase/transposase/recombinase [Candidatus Altiarchaeota archaeon]|nr:DDE-type integrase/transposase/recombinase [Candidatus Altiarchaeota archaeon]